MNKKVPQDAIFRLSFYLRALKNFEEKNINVVSSKQLADFLKINHHQLRKDLSYFGHFGKKGVGYSCSILIDKIKKILGLDKVWSAAVIGFGNLGRALSFYKGFKEQGVYIKVAFDIDIKKINKEYGGIKVYSVDLLEKIIKKEDIQIAIITVPKEYAQEIAYRLSKCKIKAILNFAPINLVIPGKILIQNVDFGCQLAYLTYHLKLLESDYIEILREDNPIA
ncbi:MAG: redox-sensing transcriptional repressor Rex [Candidatus Omnitrophica bacterium]|nr:redox-sensing transcriptional repressor Rex [Candidatus Omnitrophota bacterium]